MAINFTVSYTFSPNTTISSTQVNTNFSDNANVWTGLEALTKTFAKLKVDVDPTTALEVATKQYVDHLMAYRRPVLQFATVATVTVESGLDGTAGDIPILFPDGNLRTETSTTNSTFNIARNTALSGTTQSGLRATLSEAANTTYFLYAVKVTDNSTHWVTVGDTLSPIRANFSTLNTNFGISGWVYLGSIKNGNGSGGSSDILSFVQTGNLTKFNNINSTTSSIAMAGYIAATTAGATSLTYSAALADFGANITQMYFTVDIPAVNAGATVRDSASGKAYATKFAINERWICALPAIPSSEGIEISLGSSVAMDVIVQGYVDGALGIGSNPLL